MHIFVYIYIVDSISDALLPLHSLALVDSMQNPSTAKAQLNQLPLPIDVHKSICVAWITSLAMVTQSGFPYNVPSRAALTCVRQWDGFNCT